jgi:hypothetical protein
MLSRALLTTALALTGASATPLSCDQLSTSLQNANRNSFNPLYLNVAINHFAAQTAINISNVPYNLTTNVLPAFCRTSFSPINPPHHTHLCLGVQLTLPTSPNTTINTEVWLPDSVDWNGRLLGTGVGGLAGGGATLFGSVASRTHESISSSPAQ